MRILRLFETQLRVQDNGFIEFNTSRPLFEVIENESRLVGRNVARLNCILKAGVHIIFMRLNVEVETVGGVLRPVRGTHPQPPDSQLFIERLMPQPVRPSLNAQMALLSGAFNFVNTRFPLNGVISDERGRLTFHFQQLKVTNQENSPLWIDLLASRLSNQGFYLDLGFAASADGNRPRVVFLPKTFQATAATRLQIPGALSDVLSLDLLASQEAIFSLERLIESPELRFEPAARAGATVQLYADLLHVSKPYSAASNPIIAPMEVEQFNLVARLAQLNESLSKITSASFTPPTVGGAGSFRLTSYTYSDSHNQPIVWRVASDMKLHLRTGTARRPATFLIAPEYAEGRAALAVERVNPGEIHGFNESSRFKATRAARLVCDVCHPPCDTTPRANAAAGIDDSIVSEMTAPWFDFPGTADTSAGFKHIKPGQNYVAASSAGLAAVDTYAFKGSRVALPALPSLSFRDRETRALEEQTLERINRIIAGSVRDEVRPIRHETFIREVPASGVPDNIRVTRAFRPKPDAFLAPGRETEQDVKLAVYRVTRQVGPVQIKLAIDPDKHRDFVVLRAGQEFEFLDPENSFKFRLDRHRLDFTLGGGPDPRGTPRPFGILKLSKKFTLAEIFQMSGIPDGGFLQSKVHSTVQQREWVGLILFSLPVSASAQENSQVLRSLIPDGLKLEYVALTSDKPPDGDSADARYSVTARLTWTAPTAEPDPAADPASNETVFALKSLDVEWYDSALSFLHAEALLKFNSFFGVETSPPPLKILGSYDKAKDTIRFLGQLQKPLLLLPPDMFGPIKQVEIRGAEIVFARGQTAVSLDGRITLGDFMVFKVGDKNFADFDGLQIRLPERNPDGRPLRLAIDYPNLRFSLDIPAFKLGFLSLKLGGLRVHFKPNDFDARGLVKIPPIHLNPPTLGNAALFFELRLELMKLPELAAKALDRLILDFVIGLGANGANFDSARVRAWLRAVSFEGLKLDLMRFLTIKAAEVGLESKDPPTVPGQPNPPGGVLWIKFREIEITVLNTVVVKNLTVFIFSAAGDKRGFIGYYETANTGDQNGLLDIKWVLIGHNVRLNPALAAAIMKVEPTAEAPPGSTPIRTQISRAVDSYDILPATGETQQGAWVFAAGFKFMGELLDGKFLFQDKAYYGICLGGGIFKEWFGYDFAVSVLYIKAAQPNQDSFIVSVRVPQVTLPAFNFMGGVVTIEVVMDGGFMLDAGFPRLAPGGGRQWDRAFGAIVSPFQGSGGFYIEKRHVESAIMMQVGGQEVLKGLLVGGGYAVQGGLGTSFGGAVFRVWATVGVYFILEGAIFLGRTDADPHIHLRGLKLVGANGILVRAAGELNWWIISVRVELMLSAEARATLVWGSFFLGTGDEDSARLTLDFELFASAHAEACIGRWKFKICKGITVTLPLRFSHTLTLRA